MPLRVESALLIAMYRSISTVQTHGVGCSHGHGVTTKIESNWADQPFGHWCRIHLFDSVSHISAALISNDWKRVTSSSSSNPRREKQHKHTHTSFMGMNKSHFDFGTSESPWGTHHSADWENVKKEKEPQTVMTTIGRCTCPSLTGRVRPTPLEQRR